MALFPNRKIRRRKKKKIASKKLRVLSFCAKRIAVHAFPPLPLKHPATLHFPALLVILLGPVTYSSAS